MRVHIVALVALVAALVPFTACGGDAPSGSGNEGEGEGDFPVGAEAYEVQCTICHGANGGAGADAPQIANPQVAYATYVVRNGHSVMDFTQEMPRFVVGDLPDADLTDILTFLRSQPHPADGAGLYTRFCFNCHGANGHGGRVFPNISGASSTEVSQRVRAGHHTSNVADFEYMPAFSADELTDAEVALIAGAL